MHTKTEGAVLNYFYAISQPKKEEEITLCIYQNFHMKCNEVYVLFL
jgi:hypothetical protein